jgi:predicted acyltransferase
MNQRYYSLDVFRGATVALMILVNNPGSWSNIFPPLEHAPWHGCTPTDLVFPFFLFAVGNAMAFVMPKFEEKGTAFFFKKVVKRTILIFAIGLFLNWSPFVKWSDNVLVAKPWESIRILGVLQRIAICYFFASIAVYFFKVRGAFVFSAVLLLAYWLLCWFSNTADPYSLQGYFGTAIDKSILGETHMYKGEGVPFDPEGLTNSLAAIVQVILGYLVGQYIQQKGKTYEMLSNLFVAGIVLLLAGFCWDMVFPINKKIWTSSYTIYTTGLAIVSLATLIYLIEFKQAKGVWSKFFDVFGKNPLFIFVLSGFLPRVVALFRINDGLNPEGKPIYLSAFSWFYKYVCKDISTDLRVGSLVYALIMIAFYWLIVYVMDKKKVYIKV